MPVFRIGLTDLCSAQAGMSLRGAQRLNNLKITGRDKTTNHHLIANCKAVKQSNI
jgi:hypothetical protein